MKPNNKNKFLIAGLAAALWLCYNFAIANTVAYYGKYRDKKAIVDSSENQPALLSRLSQKENQLDRILENYSNVTENSFQNVLLSQLSELSEKYGLSLVDFKEPHNYSEKGITTTSYRFSLRGGFNGILLVINTIENNPSLGFVKHISFVKRKDYKANTDYLVGEIILQKSGTTGNR